MPVNWRREQCSLKAFGLGHGDGVLFVTSQWGSRSPRNVLIYALYETVVFLYILAMMIYAPIANNMGAKFVIFLTYWGFICLTCCFASRCLATWLCYFRGLDTACTGAGSIPWFLKLQWIFYNLAAVLAPIVSAVFWSLSFNGDLKLANFSTHGMNLIIVVVDLFITAHPFRILHLYQPMILEALYAIFIGIYWAAEGTNDKGKHAIYAFSDFDKNMALAVGGLVALVFAVVPISICVIFLLYQLRLLISRKCCGCLGGKRVSSSEPPETIEMS